MPTLRLSFRIVAPVVLVTALAAGLAVYFNLSALERTLADIEQSRLRFTLDELRTRLAAPGQGQAALDFTARRDPDIASISVTDGAGAVLLHTGAALPAPPARLHQEPFARDAAFITARTTLADGAGELVIRYSLRRHGALVASASRRLTLVALAAVLACAACFVFAIEALARRMDATLGALDMALGEPRPGAAGRGQEAALAGQVRLTSKSALYEVSDARQALASEDVFR